jgi:hypothetical protein
VIIQVWGRHERCDLEAMKVIARPLMPPRPADAPPEPELWRLGALERMATEAGLVPQDAFDTTWASSYPDEETLGRAMVARGRDRRTRRAVTRGGRRGGDHRRVVRPSHGRAELRLENEFHYLIARAWTGPWVRSG